MTQAVLFHYTDDAVQILSRFEHLPWLFLLLHNENLLLKLKIVYCKKNTQQPKTAVFEQLVRIVQPTGFPEDREMYKKVA